MRRVQKGWQFWYKLTCQLEKGRVTCVLWLLSCLLHVVSWSYRQSYGGLTERAMVVSESRARCLQEESCCWHPPWPQQQRKFSLRGSWCGGPGAGGFKGWQMWLCAVADCCFVACFWIVFWLFSAFLLTLLFSEMNYPVSNCSQIVIIVCRQMAHSLWSSNHTRETAALGCVYKYWCWSVAVSWGPVWAALPPAVVSWFSLCPLRQRPTPGPWLSIISVASDGSPDGP